MIRKLLATVLIGTFLAALCGPAFSRECKQVDMNAKNDCREIPHAELGPRYCLNPEKFGFRSMTSGAASNPWVTSKPIELDPYTLNGSSCRKQISFSGDDLSITKTGDQYAVSLTGTTPLTFTANMTRHGNNDLWLSGADAQNMHYYVFFRDRSAANHALPKFLVIEALDGDDKSCIANAPKLGTTVAGNPCVAPHPNPKLPNESGVGGGGEIP